MNLAHITFFGLFICALCKVQSVNFVKLSAAFEVKAKAESSLRRIQRFMAECNFDFDLIAQLIFRLLPHKPPFRLAMDRTNWKFGIVNINVLMLAVVYKGVAFPLTISMLDKRGNSHTNKCIAFVWAYVVGIFAYAHLKSIRILKNGLQIITTMLLNTKVKINIDIFKFLSYTKMESNSKYLLHSNNVCADSVQSFFNSFVSAVYLVNILNCTRPFGTHSGNEQCNSGTNIR